MNKPTFSLGVFGTKFWRLNGQYHREDGPAVEWTDGSCDWYFRDKQIEVNSQEEFE
jgi:hypothetical protein